MNTPRTRNIGLRLRRAIVAICCATLVGCYTLQPLGGAAPGLHEEIRAGRLVKVGDSVRITTIDGKHHEFMVRAIDDTAITGQNRSVPIENIARIERAKLNTVRTLLLVGGVLAVIVGLAASSANMSPSFGAGGASGG